VLLDDRLLKYMSKKLFTKISYPDFDDTTGCKSYIPDSAQVEKDIA